MQKRFYLYLILLSIPLIFSSCFSQMVDKESQGFTNESLSEGNFEVIIVPGYPFDGEKWDKVMKMRVVWSYYLYKTGLAKNIIYSGSAVYTPYVESRIMRMYAIELGIPSEHIFIEEEAEHSTENIFLSYKMAKSMGFNRIALATDPFQNKWMYKFYKEQNFDMQYLPSQMHIVDSLAIGNPIIAKDSAFVEDFVSIKKRESFRQRWRGTQGKNIDFEKGIIVRD